MITVSCRPKLCQPVLNASFTTVLPPSFFDCTDCPLHSTANRAVPGVGPQDAEIMFLGEGPGGDEDHPQTGGRPFVGRAGRVLDGVLRESKLSRADVYITNIVKHRPPGNREPQPQETAACARWLDLEQQRLTRLRLIVCLGGTAAARYFPAKATLGSMRTLPGGIVVVSTYHPSYVLRARRPAIRQSIIDSIQQGMTVAELC